MSDAVASEICITDALERAHAHWDAGKLNEARRLCKNILTSWPGNAGAFPLTGLLAYLAGNLEVAIDHLRHAWLNPGAPADYWSNLSELYLRRGLVTDAEAAARRAVVMYPEHVSAWNNLGLALHGGGNFEESRDCFERAIELEPHWAEGHNNLGNAYRRLGLLPYAAWHYIKAVTLKPDFAEAHSNIAFYHIAKGEADAAAAAARHAIELDPRLADAYLNLAEAETLRERYRAALEVLDALSSFAPDHPAGAAARTQVMKRIGRGE